MTVLSVVLFASVLFVPESTSAKDIILWFIGAIAALSIVKLIWAELDKWYAEDKR